ncbi:MAG: hypothetical protein CM1200mP3_11100 [Chloroflexota bacterium]|nr:MAG: hypothetical protein CM1200mP3_11100 [Chloroflexota bacterium]
MATKTTDLTLLKHKSGIVSLGPDRHLQIYATCSWIDRDDMEKPL